MKQQERDEGGGSQAKLWSNQFVTSPAKFWLSLNPSAPTFRFLRLFPPHITAQMLLFRSDLNNPNQGQWQSFKVFPLLGVFRCISTEDKILRQKDGTTRVNKSVGEDSGCISVEGAVVSIGIWRLPPAQPPLKAGLHPWLERGG